MDQQTYLKKLSCALHWRLPGSEAEDVLSDYQEIFSQRPAEADDRIIRDLGEPLQAARLLTEPDLYRRWLAAFGLMSFCLALPEFLLLRARFYGYPAGMMFLLLAAGTAAALMWFGIHRREREIRPLPKGLCPMLAGLLVVLAAAALILAGLAAEIWKELPPALYGIAAYWTMSLAGTAAAVLGFFGLVKARISDRRWRALYITGLTVLAECVLVTAALVSMDLDAASSGWWVSYAGIMGGIGFIGLAGAGVSLC
ncbi:HAAS signaling domain-containing protein [Schaedlerella arabinosiphila]|uniref:HAAS signaling domain-containing protein n=1 Tax=Schaedlerella arabinosiphila TaxID=2044587 RepID=UPI0025583ABD|nr:DUF1700 domain-containing protein [Schaedlerella arabinosiphila]